DFMVCNEDANYGYTDAERHYYPSTAEAVLLSERLGSVQAEELLYLRGGGTGKQLRARGWRCAIAPAGGTGARAEQVAWPLATKPREALRLLKQHLTRDLVGIAKKLGRIEETVGSAADELLVAAQISSPADHIEVESLGERVAMIRLRSGAGKIESTELAAQLGEVF